MAGSWQSSENIDRNLPNSASLQTNLKPPFIKHGVNICSDSVTKLPYTSERGGYPGWGWGVIGPDVVDLDFASLSFILTLCFIFTKHNKMPELYPNRDLRRMVCVFFFKQFLE